MTAPGTSPLPFPFPAPPTFPTTALPGTRLLDAVYRASHDLLKGEIGRKAILLLSDGVDQGSRVDINEAIEAAHRSDVIIYSVHIRGTRNGRDRCRGEILMGHSVLKKLSEETGGRVIIVERERDTAEAFQEIAEELRTQYFLGFTPSDLRHDGSYHKIRLRVRGGDYKIQARRGYYAPTQ